jgi:hypothetical protein
MIPVIVGVWSHRKALQTGVLRPYSFYLSGVTVADVASASAGDGSPVPPSGAMVPEEAFLL